MDTGRRPLCGCFVLSCRRDKVPARNTDRPSGFAFTPRKKFLGVPRGVFSKTLLGREWDSVPQKESASQSARCAFSGGTRSFHETPTDRPALPLRPEKSFWGFQGAFFQKRALGREWDSVPEKEKTPELAQTERVPTPVRGHLQEAEAVNQRR